ncbi:MAG: AmmeMemoRadiSam system protein B [Candidatus Methanoplasma sp.]|jgi:AmmeMemoRadiSam system protein B|nr:AmmeMemoRadiSam system protein B [Candidatus Methanoplasma sp.]
MRCPAVAGRFYPLEKKSLLAEVEAAFLHRLGPGLPAQTGCSRRISAAVCPHAGYAASGMNAAHAYRKIVEDGLPEAYVIIGPDHYGVPFRAVMCGEDYLTPLGRCRIHTGIANALRERIPDDCNAHRLEHSIEVQIPFIQYIDPDPQIVPIIMGDQSIDSAERLATALKESCKGRDVIVVASSDMSHYVPKDVAERLDRPVLERLENMDVEGMYSEIERNGASVCGYGPMAAALLFAEPSSVEILRYSDSFDSLGRDRSSVVGYASAVMYK